MRIGIFSDVHANLEALQAVIRAYEDERIDKFICLGDTVGYGASPEPCAELVRQKVATTILGNHDAAVAGRMDYSFYYDAAREVLDRHQRALSSTNMAWLRSLPYEHREMGISFCHGSPINIEDYDYIFAIDQAAKLLPHYEQLADVTFLGHSHLCKSFALTPTEVYEVVASSFPIREGFKYIISVGSVGQPRDEDPRSSYTIFDLGARTFDFKRVPYDIEKSAQKIFDSGLERNFGNRLFIGV